tara:strand:+ start:54 stop:830 length:777 start_codon:yes stop_codon:yes gene_type:complete
MEGNTLTMESEVETTSIDNLSEEEQDSLAVGEKMQEAEEQLLAGKYKSAAELEKGYLELQQKLNTKAEPQEETEAEAEPETEAEQTILDRVWEEATSGKDFSQELTEELSQIPSTELANMYLDYRQSNQANTPENRDFSADEITQLKGVVGGDKNYGNMIDWAQKSLTEQEVNMFDQVMQKGDPLAAFFAVRSLAYAYNDAVGYDGNVVQGKAPKQSSDQFRSQAEVIKAMGDSRYENDPAYRQDIMDKLTRSPDVNF